jgi:hypothetical protein
VKSLTVLCFATACAASVALAAPALAQQTTAAQPTKTAASQPAAGTAQPPGNTPRIRWEHTVRDIKSGPWKGKRLADGQPDVAGDWSNTIANHNNWTDPQGGIPNDPSTRNHKQGPRAERAPSRVSEPSDGAIPFQPWARAYQEEFLAHLFDPVKPEYIEPFARCAPGGILKSMTWHGYEIRQYPGYIVFLFNSGTRIIHLNKEPPLPENIKLWNGDSRGHWEGNTLVVEIHNDNEKARFARTGEFASENAKIEERYIFDGDGKHYNYVATVTDPTVYTRPWSTTIPARRYTVDDPMDDWHYEAPLANTSNGQKLPDHFERNCVENNGGFGRVAAPAAVSNNSSASPSSAPAAPAVK